MATIPNISESNGRQIPSAATPEAGLLPKSSLNTPKGVKDRDRQRRAIELKVAGWTYSAIAKEMGTSRQRVQQLVRPSIQTLGRLVERAKHACEKCGLSIKGHNAHVHHVDEHAGVDAYNSLENLRYLCNPCHRREHVGVPTLFTHLPVGERRAAAESFVGPFMEHVHTRFCVSCGKKKAHRGLCKECSKKARAVTMAKERLALWQRAATKTSSHGLSQAIYIIRKHNLKPEDFAPCR